MSWNQLPPVGTKALSWSADYAASPLNFVGFDYTLVNSGTAALGAILRWAVQQRSGDARFTVVIPGYACPDLVAACVYANATPVIVDLEADSYQYNQTQIAELGSAIDAIICPALFGISMPLQPLRDSVGQQTLIIEDNAQWFPETEINCRRISLEKYKLPENTHQADFFITSFGRGKPVNLLGGGMLAWNNERVNDFKLHLNAQSESSTQLRFKSQAFNMLCHPFLYGALTRAPGLNLGATEYHPLTTVESLSGARQQGMTAAVLAYLRGHCEVQQQLLQAAPVLWPEQASHKRLLRFPLIAHSKENRDALVAQLNRAGLGASPMYARSLASIEGVKALVQTPFSTPVCQQLADGLLTLPLHKGVKPKHVQQMIHIIDAHRQWLASKPAA